MYKNTGVVLRTSLDLFKKAAKLCRYRIFCFCFCCTCDAATLALYLFPPPYTRGSTHMSSSGVESMISWNSDHSSLLPIPIKTWRRHHRITFQLHPEKTGYISVTSSYQCWHSWSPGKPAPPYSGWAAWHFSCGSRAAWHQTRRSGGSPRWWGWLWRRGLRRWVCWTCFPCCWVWPPLSRTPIHPP